MAIEYYDDGTVTLANGSTTATGTGTAWTFFGVTGGILVAPGLPGPIPVHAVEGDGELTLKWPSPVDLTDVDYIIYLVPADQASIIRLAELQAQIMARNATVAFRAGARGSLGGRDAYDDEPEGFQYGIIDNPPLYEFYEKASDASGDWVGPFQWYGPEGEASAGLRWIGEGWSSGVDYEVDDALTRNGSSYRCIADHTSAAATAPGTGADWETRWALIAAIGNTGPAPNLAIGTVTDVGADGPPTASVSGSNPNYELNLGLQQGTRGWAPVFAIEADGDRRVKKLVDYVGGTGTKPTANIGEYVGASGYTATIGSAADVRGPIGDIDGVTPFWQDRITTDATAEDARTALGVGYKDETEKAAFRSALGLSVSTSLLALALSEFVGTYVATGDAFADGFVSLGMVDTAGATNLDTSEAGYLKPAVAAGGEAGTAPFGGGGGRGIGSGNGNNFALQFIAPASGKITTTKINVPNFTTTGTFEARLYTDNAGSPGTQVGVASGSVSISSTGDKTFTFGTPPSIVNGTTYWMVLANTGGSPAFNVSTQANTGTAFKSGRGDVITSITDNLPSSEEWEVSITYVGVPANLTVASEIIPVGFEPTDIFGKMRVVPTDALTLNTDIMLDVSRDDGSTWNEVELDLSFTDGGVSVLSFDPVDVSGDPSGTEPRWRIRSDNGKAFKVDGIALEFQE